MEKRRHSALVAYTSLAFLMTSCATVSGGTTQKVSVKTQSGTEDVAGANCVLANSKGTYMVTTPNTVDVHRAKDDLSVKCTTDGGSEVVATLKSSSRTGATVGNILLLGVGGVLLEGIDKANGAAYVYPDEVTVQLEKTANQQSLIDTQIAVSPTSKDTTAHAIPVDLAPATGN